MGVQNAWVFSTNHKTTRDWVVSLVESTHAFCTRTIIGRKQGYKMREYFLLENIERKFGWKSVSIFYHFDRTISSGIKKVAEKAQKNCFPLLRSGTKKYIICPNDDLLLWTSQSNREHFEPRTNWLGDSPRIHRGVLNQMLQPTRPFTTLQKEIL